MAPYIKSIEGDDVGETSWVICQVLKLLSQIGLERGRIERELIYRSNLLQSLAIYIEGKYSKYLTTSELGYSSDILNQISQDVAIFEVFLLVLNRRLTVIDDLEF